MSQRTDVAAHRHDFCMQAARMLHPPKCEYRHVVQRVDARNSALQGVRMKRQRNMAARGVTRDTLVAVLAMLGACSGGGGGVDVGSGQEPDPATVDFPIFYVKRTIPMDSDDLRQMRDTAPDAELFKRDRASPSAPEVNVTDRVTGADLWDVKDVDVSTDGQKVLLAMRGPLAMNQDEE